MGHHSLPSTLRRAVDYLRDTAEEYGDRANAAAERTSDRTSRYTRYASRRMHGRRDDARSELARLWHQIEDLMEHRLRPAANDAGRYARAGARSAAHYAGEGRDIAMDAADRLRVVTRTHPLTTLGLAVAATWVIASLLNHRR